MTRFQFGWSTAEFLYEKQWPRQLEIICYHCQQSGEKAVKALYLAAEIPGGIPKKHDLWFLLEQIKGRVVVPESILEAAEELDPYAIIVRYPSENKVDDNLTKKALRQARLMKEMVYMSRAADLVKQYGVTVFSPGYRLAWRKPFPAAVEDCFSVLRYMDEHRAQLGVKQIMVGGESAGGGLCAAVCMMARDRGIQVAFHFPLYPMLNNLDTESSRDNHGRIWNTRRNHLGWRLYLRGDAKKETVSPYASPSRQTDYSNLPPCYTFVGEGEPFYAETLHYVEDLRSAGVPAEADVYPTNVHAFDMLYPEDAVSRQAISAFEQRFGDAIKICETSAN